MAILLIINALNSKYKIVLLTLKVLVTTIDALGDI